MFYRGYMKLEENKEPYQKHKRMSRNVPDWSTVGGIFKNEYIMVDCDTREDSNLLLLLIDKYKWNTHVVATDSGIHAIFRKSSVNVPSKKGAETLSGIICDYKQGRLTWNNSDYECIIKHGKPREIIQACDDPQEIPWQLLPLSVDLHLKDVGDGSGRHGIHGTLVHRAAYYITEGYTITAAEIRDWICWINDNVFLEPRESVNWTVKQVQTWIDKNIRSYTRDELLQQINSYDDNTLNKLVIYAKTMLEAK